jgi:hypothetical protein
LCVFVCVCVCLCVCLCLCVCVCVLMCAGSLVDSCLAVPHRAWPPPHSVADPYVSETVYLESSLPGALSARRGIATDHFVVLGTRDGRLVVLSTWVRRASDAVVQEFALPRGERVRGFARLRSVPPPPLGAADAPARPMSPGSPMAPSPAARGAGVRTPGVASGDLPRRAEVSSEDLLGVGGGDDDDDDNAVDVDGFVLWTQAGVYVGYPHGAVHKGALLQSLVAAGASAPPRHVVSACALRVCVCGGGD